MKKLITAVFIAALSFSCISYADSNNTQLQPANAGTQISADSTLALVSMPVGNTPSGYATHMAQGAKSIPAAPALNRSKEDRERELKELCEFLCTVRGCVGECTDMRCLMQQMYFYTR